MAVYSYCRKCGGFVAGHADPSADWMVGHINSGLRLEECSGRPIGDACHCIPEPTGEVKAWMETAAALTAERDAAIAAIGAEARLRGAAEQERDALRSQLATCAAELLAARLHPAATPQPAPTGEGTDVHAWLMAAIEDHRLPCSLTDDFGTAVLACQDMGWDFDEAIKARAVAGRSKYGVPLMTRNGRDPFADRAQELLDALHYAAQAWLEGEGL